MAATPEQSLQAWVDYLRDMGVYDLYRREPRELLLAPEVLEQLKRMGAARRGKEAAPAAAAERARTTRPTSPVRVDTAGPFPSVRREPRPPQAVPAEAAPAGSVPRPVPAVAAAPEPHDVSMQGMQGLPPELAAPMPKPNPLAMLFAAPDSPVPPEARAAALEALRAEIGDCTRCPLAYAGRHTIVFGEGDPQARLMFVGEGPGADEDETGRPFVGKAGQLLNNMITAMGLQREQVYIANIVKCRPPGNRAPEFTEATTCSQFLLRQIDIVRPEVIVALGATAATYVLGVRQSLASLRDQWFRCRESKVAVTYHPAFLLRDPRQKAEAWKDLQRVMQELGLRPPARNG